MKQQKFVPVVQALALAFGGTVLATTAYAQSTQSLQRVEVTGSAIKRTITDETALPVTTITSKELRDTGVTSTEEALQRVAAMQTSVTSSQTVGNGNGGKATADLRGLGGNKTLVLLNGRRMASFAFDSQTVDLNSIPFSAIERIEVLRDGASAIYGTDAIGGVINFITKKSFKGLDLTAEALMPQQAGAGQKRVSIGGGFGDLDEQGFNIWANYDIRRVDQLMATQRDFGRTGYDPSRKLNLTSGTTYAANFFQASTGISGNPSAAAGCSTLSPLSIKTSAAATTCRYDYTGAIQLIPEQELQTFASRGSLKLGEHILALEYTRAQNKNTSRVAPDPVTGITMPNTSPYFPSTYPGIDTTTGISGIGWRMEPAGKRTNTASTTADRVVLDLSGTVANWDYRTGLFASSSVGSQDASDGYVNNAKIKAGVASGLLNPFGAQTAAGTQYIMDSKNRGVYTNAKGATQGFDVRASRELFALPGGNAALSAGAEYRRETYKNDTDDALVNAMPSLGASPYHVSGSRNVTAVMAEVLLPVMKQLELTAAARYDKYSDFGSTFNPKVGFRFQPTQAVMLRGSYNTGFRAPALDDLYGPQTIGYTGNSYDDPVLCPGGVVNAAKGGVAARDCGMQFNAQGGGNPKLKPEKSKSFNLGVAFQPVQNATFSIDYWNIELTNQISAFPEQAVVNDPAKYASRIIRCSQVTDATLKARLDGCNYGGAGDPIGYLVLLSDNLGGVKTDGFDIAASYGLNTGIGRFAFNYASTYVNNYKYQRIQSDPYVQNVGLYLDATPIFRWQHTFGADYRRDKLGVNLALRNKSGYTDQNANNEGNTVGSYTLVDLGASYTIIKGLTVTGVVKNLFNTKPPFSNQGTVFQKGYDPRFTDPTMRAFMVRLNYQFK